MILDELHLSAVFARKIKQIKGITILMGKLESQIAEYVGNYTRRRGYPPTVEELISSFGIVTVMFMMFYILSLYRIGMIRNSLFFGVGDLQLIPMKIIN